MAVKKGQVNLDAQGLELTKIYLKDITDNDNVFVTNPVSGEVVKTGKGGQIPLPYRLHFCKEDGKVFMTEDTLGTLRAREWEKKFRRKTGKDGVERVEAWGNNGLLFIFKMFEKREGKEFEGIFDINDLIGFDFEARVWEYEGQYNIDWVNSLKANQIEIPEVDNLPTMPSTTGTAREVSVDEAKDAMNQTKDFAEELEEEEKKKKQNEFAKSIGEPEQAEMEEAKKTARKKMPWEN